MRIRESGMPGVELWRTFFDPARIIDKLGIGASNKHVVEFGCGYGTFTIPTARCISGRVSTFDLDRQMLDHAKEAARLAAVDNIEYLETDFFDAAEVLGAESADYVMLFNILHGENPRELLEIAYTLLVAGGKAGIIHWNYDPDTPRGPPMTIRPRPEALAEVAAAAGFEVSDRLELPPYHYGFMLTRNN